MNAYLLLPLLMGLAVVIQGSLNRKIGEAWGLSAALLLNAAVLLSGAAVLFLITRALPDLMPAYFRLTGSKEFKIWYVVPGLCGLFLVLGLPWSLQNIGASKSFVLFIAAQILVSLLADWHWASNTLTTTKFIGAALTLAGAILVILS